MIKRTDYAVRHLKTDTCEMVTFLLKSKRMIDFSKLMCYNDNMINS